MVVDLMHIKLIDDESKMILVDTDRCERRTDAESLRELEEVVLRAARIAHHRGLAVGQL
ncbi:MAG TPA: hypothetical protein VK537_01800 [Galbitalea sp.]|nr:hypothetical protein [Galbitalea sp.]